MKPNVLIIEDEESIREGLVDVLTYHGYQVSAACQGQEGLYQALHTRYHLILVDVMLPLVDGFTICQQIRQKDKYQPIIVLTAKDQEEDIVRGFKLGIDDYIRKPFAVRELVARVEAVLRRSSFLDYEKSKIKWHDYLIDPVNLLLERSGALSIELSRREVDILLCLHKHQHRPVSRQELLKDVWGYANTDIDTRTVDIHINKLRKKIEPDPEHPVHLVTIRKEGYRLL